MIDDEARGELIEQVAAFRAVDETIKTAGWQKFLLPRFERLKEAHLCTLRTATDLPTFTRGQEGLKAIEMLLTDIDICISEGKEAIDQLAKEKLKDNE